MQDDMKGKVALVTGGGSGIGQASAVAFAKRGAKVVVADISEKGGMETVSLIEELGGEAFFVKADVSKSADVQAMVNKAIEKFGRLDYAHNNAGIDGPLETVMLDLQEEDWDKVIAVNLKSVWLCMRFEIEQMLKQGKGSIINTASMFGLVGNPGGAAYNAAKHGVVGLTKTGALEYSSQGIRVNAVCPGVILTPLVRKLTEMYPEATAALSAQHPIGRCGEPEEVAKAVVWLASDDSSFVNGVSMPVDGGFVAK
jgi:NAD(P)-dependent dehydrogenase (short-subunit alcohol dehydrogenase family)